MLLFVFVSQFRLSQNLKAVIDDQDLPELVTPNHLMSKMGHHGIYLVLILLSLPFVVPLPLPPGFSSIVGPVIVLLALRLAFGISPLLPKSLGDRSLSLKRIRQFFHFGNRFLRYVEKWAKPRGTQWLSWRTIRFMNAVLLAFMALVLALPIPPVVPMSNSLPSYAIILLAASMMERDGILIWFAYGISLGTTLYLASTAGVVIRFALQYTDSIIGYVSSMI